MPAEDFEDLGDEMSRLGKRLLRDREELVENILGGLLPYPDYLGQCQRVQQIDQTLQMMGQIRRGEDRKKPAVRESPNVEV